MLRVLHLMSANPDLQTTRGAQTLACGLGDTFAISTRTIGRGGDLRNLPLALASLARLSRQFELIHTWDLSALLFAALGTTRPLVFSPSHLPSRAQTGWVRGVMRCRRVQFVVTSSRAREILVHRGIRPEHCEVIPPPIALSRIPPRDHALRAKLGIDPQDFVLLAPGESMQAAGHRVAVWAASILHVLDTRYRLLLWGRGDGARAAQVLANKLGQPGLVIVAEQHLGRPVEFEQLTPVADMALATSSPHAPLLPAAVCMAAGLPIVAAHSSPISESLCDGQNALIVPEMRPRILVKQIVELRNDADEMRRLGAAAQLTTAQRFDPCKFIDAYRNVYARAAAQA